MYDCTTNIYTTLPMGHTFVSKINDTDTDQYSHKGSISVAREAKIRVKIKDLIHRDMTETGVQREEAQNRRTWRMKSRCANPNQENG